MSRRMGESDDKARLEAVSLDPITLYERAGLPCMTLPSIRIMVLPFCTR